MRRKKELSERVTVTYPDGHSETYLNLATASESSGLSINSIKTRCSKPGAGKSKDGITCVWADEKTRRSKQAKRNKQKGNGFEREIVNKLKEYGYSGCVSSRSQNKLADANKIDIVDINEELPVNIQAKYTQNTPNYFAIRDACSDKMKPFVVCWKKATTDGSNSKAVAIIPLDYFYTLIKK